MLFTPNKLRSVISGTKLYKGAVRQLRVNAYDRLRVRLFGKLPGKPHWRQPKKGLNHAENFISQWFEAKNKL